MTMPFHARPPAVDAVLLDFDGTLMDTDHAHWSCWDEALRAWGGSLDRHTYNTECAGRQTLTIAAHCIAKQRLSAAPQDVASRKEVTFRAWLTRGEMAWMPGAQQAFSGLQARGLKLAVVTSSPRDIITAGLRQRGLLDALDAVVTGDDVPRNKPAPDCYLLCLEQLGVPASRCVAFEDTEHGVRAAAAAGIRCLAVRPPSAGPQDFSQATGVFVDLPAAAAWLFPAPPERN